MGSGLLQRRTHPISLMISLVGLVAVAAAAVLFVRFYAVGAWTPVAWTIIALAAISGAALAANYTLAALSAQRLTDRVAQMRDAAREMGMGDLDALVPEGADDDLGTLARALNAMAMRLKRMFEAQRDLLSGVSHELRSPLTRIGVLLELLRLEMRAADGDAAALVSEIGDELALLEEHISRLLEAQRVSTKRVVIERKRLELDPLIERVVRRDRHRLQQAGFEVHLQLGLAGAAVLGDENALDRVFSTLIENIIRHAATPPAGWDGGPELRVETTKDELGATIRVMDRGGGLTMAECAQVFEPFFRIDKSRDAKTGGTGLGMYLVRQISEAHRGRARAVPRPGGGLVVEVRLPLHGQLVLKETIRMERLGGGLDPGVPLDEA